MRPLTERLLAQFTERAAEQGWCPDFVEDDDCAGFSRPSGLDLVAGLSIDLTTRSYGLSLDPKLGVRHPKVTRLTLRFVGLPGTASQVGTSLSYLVRAARQRSGVRWVVETEEEIPQVVQRVLADVEAYGGPFLAQYNSLDDINRKLDQTAKINIEFAYLTVGYAVAGDYPEVRSVLARLQEWMAGQPPLIVQQTERFVSGFRAHFDSDI